jgi:anaerobic ribonucleoside-triphosphate reductase activating protein
MATVTPWLVDAEGVTISGGEPFEQIEALECLLSALRSVIGLDKDVLIYSGQSWEKIGPRVTAWKGLADALICDPFIRSVAQTLVWRGSDNQRLLLLTELGRRRFQLFLHASRKDLPKALDVCFDGDSIWMAGIPEAGSLGMIQRALAEVGFLSTTSDEKGDSSISLSVFA